MKRYDLRLTKKGAQGLLKRLAPSEPLKLENLGEGTHRAILSEEQMKQICRSTGDKLFLGWSIIWDIPEAILAGSTHLQLIVANTLDAESTPGITIKPGCQRCGFGEITAGPLHIDLHRAPVRRSLVKSFSGEILIRKHVAEAFADARLTGIEIQEIIEGTPRPDGPIKLDEWPGGRALLAQANRLGISDGSAEFYSWLNQPAQQVLFDQALAEYAESLPRGKNRDWRRLVVTSALVDIVNPEAFGTNPCGLDEKGQYKCEGHVLGANQLDIVRLSTVPDGSPDFFTSRQRVGWTMGEFRPEPLLFVSQRAYKVIKEHAKGSIQFLPVEIESRQ